MNTKEMLRLAGLLRDLDDELRAVRRARLEHLAATNAPLTRADAGAGYLCIPVGQDACRELDENQRVVDALERVLDYCENQIAP